MWARKEGNEIKRYSYLPKNYKNHIGFDRLMESEHESYGFYKITIPIFDLEVYKQTNKIIEVTESVDSGEVNPETLEPIMTDKLVGYTYELEEIVYPTLEDAKIQKIAELKQKGNDKLKETDWYIIRKVEKTKDIPKDVKKIRDDIRQYIDDTEIIINGITDVLNVIKYNINI